MDSPHTCTAYHLTGTTYPRLTQVVFHAGLLNRVATMSRSVRPGIVRRRHSIRRHSSAVATIRL